MDTSLGETGEEIDTKTRAEMLDEGIDLIHGLWKGELQFSGKHYTVDLTGRADLAAVGAPVQEQIPIWCVGVWPRPKSMRRIVRCEGLIPQAATPSGPAEVREMFAWLRERGGAGEGFDLMMEGETQPGDDAAVASIRALAEAGATWWLETRWELPHESDRFVVAFCARPFPQWGLLSLHTAAASTFSSSLPRQII